MSNSTEIAQIEKINKGLTGLNSTINQTSENYLKLVKSISDGNKQIQDSAISFEGLAKKQKETTEQARQLDSLDKKLIISENKLKEIEDKRFITLTKNRTESQRLTAETKRQVIAQNSLKGSYDKINASLNSNISKYKALSEEERKNSKVGGQLLKTIKSQDKALKNLDSELGRSQRHVGDYRRALSGTAKNLIGAFGVVGGVAAFASILKKSISKVVEFEKAQSELASVLGTTSDNIAKLTEDALKYGGITKFTAAEVSSLQKELAKLGFTQSEIVLSTKSILDLAAATGSDLGEAAKTAGAALRAFDLDASQSNRVASVLAVATTKTALSFEDYANGLSNVAPVAKAFGFSIEDTIALFGKLRDAGFDASKATTATRNIILNLADSGGDLNKALGGNITTFDDLINGLIQLNSDGVSLNETLELTDKRSVAAFNKFLTGAKSARILSKELSGVTDQLDRMVETQLDNLAGDVTKLSSAWDNFVLKGRSGYSVFRDAVQVATDNIIKLANLDLFLTRTSKFTSEQIARQYDILLSLNDETSKRFQKAIEFFDDISIESTKELRNYFLQQLDDIGYSEKESEKLWDEYLRRRIEQQELEKKAAEDNLKAQEEAAVKAALAKEEAEEKAANELSKKREKQRKEDEKKLIASEKLKGKAIIDNLSEQDRLIKQSIEEKKKDEFDYLAEYEDELDSEVQYFADAEAKKQEIAKDSIEKQKALEQELSDVKINSIIDGVASVFQINENFNNKKLEQLEEEKQRLLANDQLTTEQREKIQADYALKEQEIQKKQKIANKIQSGIDIGISAARSIFEIKAAAAVLLSNPLTAALAPIALAQIPFVLASSGLALASIAAFNEGTENAPDKFIAGDKKGGGSARELIFLRDGSVMLVNEPTYFEGSKFKGAKIKSNPETENIISQTERLEFRGKTMYDDRIIKALSGVEKAIKSKPVLITDSNGNIKGYQKGNHKEIYWNRITHN